MPRSTLAPATPPTDRPATSGSPLARLREAGLASPPAPLAAGEGAVAWIEALTAALPPCRTLPLLEHFCGALPLLAAAFPASSQPREVAPARRGEVLLALGLFTPNPAFSLGDGAMAALPAGEDGFTLAGKIRLSSDPAAEGTRGVVVLLHLPDGQGRLGLLPLPASGVEVRGSWLFATGAPLAGSEVSGPLSSSGGIPTPEVLDRLAATSALAAALHARGGITALRRAAREATGGRDGAALSSSQLVAMGLTELEIEVALAESAARQHLSPLPGEAPAAPPAVAGRGGEEVFGRPGLALATAAVGILTAVAERTARLEVEAGLAVGGPLATARDREAARLFFGGPRMAESALATSLDL